jgi:hypothetical protein
MLQMEFFADFKSPDNQIYRNRIHPGNDSYSMQTKTIKLQQGGDDAEGTQL